MSAPMESSVLVVDPKYAHLASDDQVYRASTNLKAHGFEVVVVDTAEEARRAVLERIPSGSEVLDASSRTLEETGIARALTEMKGISLLKPRLYAMDRATQAAEIRRLSQAPEVIVGSVHAVTEGGQVLIGSGSGSQLGPYAFGAGRVIWVVGSQKIVPTLEEALLRLELYSLPLEDARALQAYGVHSALNRTLIVRGEPQPGRTTILIVKQKLGF